MKILSGTSSVSIQSTRYLSNALNEKGHKADILVFKPNSLLVGYEDINLNIDTKKYYMYPLYLFKVLGVFMKCMRNYDVFHFHFARTFFPYNFDLILLKRFRKKIVMEYHGSEIRRKSAFKRTADLGMSENKSYKKQRRISKWSDGIIVHDHELYENLFDFNIPVHIMPLRIDLQQFYPQFPEKRDEIVIVHAPSKGKVKGSEYIVKAVRNLALKYRIRFLLLEGLPNSEIHKIMQSADIVIDQLIVGTYGMFSIESMAMGKPTICYLREDLIEKFPEVPPIQNASIYNIEDRIEELIMNYSLRLILGKRGRKYVEDYHDCRKIANQAISVYSK